LEKTSTIIKANCQPIPDRIIESLRLENTSMIIKTNCQPITLVEAASAQLCFHILHLGPTSLSSDGLSFGKREQKLPLWT